MRSSRYPPSRPLLVGRALREQRRGEAAGDGTFTRSAWPMEQVCVRRIGAGRERRCEHGARMRLVIELRQHSSRSYSSANVAAITMTRGRLITVEGLDGAGKSTLASALAQSLDHRGIEVRLLREPGGVRVAERVRQLVKDPELVVGARAEALLYAAARAQLVEEAITPLLRDCTWVLLDRFVDSSLAYQGAGRSLGIDAIRAINDFATGGIRPDRTLLLELNPALARERSRIRAQAVDRLEREGDAFFERIASAYSELARQEPERVRKIDAAQDPDSVLAAALEALSDLL
jgi:dTMP kinase